MDEAHAQAELRFVLDELGLTDTPIETIVIVSDDDAAATGFTGSPSCGSTAWTRSPHRGRRG